jgi:hypothetical protein
MNDGFQSVRDVLDVLSGKLRTKVSLCVVAHD